MLSADDNTGENGLARTLGPASTPSSDLARRQNLIGLLENQLIQRERTGCDLTLARLAIARQYSAYATDVIGRTGGDLQELKTLTDRNNQAPLRWADGTCAKLD